jgi:hypothetical protein
MASFATRLAAIMKRSIWDLKLVNLYAHPRRRIITKPTRDIILQPERTEAKEDLAEFGQVNHPTPTLLRPHTGQAQGFPTRV